MTRTEAILIRVRQLSGEHIAPNLVQEAIAIIQQPEKKNPSRSRANTLQIKRLEISIKRSPRRLSE